MNDELQKRLHATSDAGRPDAVEKRRKTGQRTARENVADLADPGSFVEYGGLALAAQRHAKDVADLVKASPADGIVCGLCTVNGQRGRVVIFKLDDGSEAIEAVAGEELFEGQRELAQEDQLLIAQGRLQPDRFTGGLRLNVSQVWDLPAARARFARHLAVEVNGGPPVGDVLRLWPSRRVDTEHGVVRQGLPVRLRLKRRHATAEIDLGDEARFWPCDEALVRWRSIAEGGDAVVVYE